MSTAVNVPKWTASGDWFDVCKCNIPCPCIFAQTPSYGDCDGVLAYHIKKGQYGKVSLDGLNVLALDYFKGPDGVTRLSIWVIMAFMRLTIMGGFSPIVHLISPL